jgi:hypothetical protein
MGVMVDLLRGQQILDVFVDSEVTYLMLVDGTQVTIRGLVVVQPDYQPLRRSQPTA